MGIRWKQQNKMELGKLETNGTESGRIRELDAAQKPGLGSRW